MVTPTDKKSITDFGSPDDFLSKVLSVSLDNKIDQSTKKYSKK